MPWSLRSGRGSLQLLRTAEGALSREAGLSAGGESPAGQYLRQAWPLTLREQGPLVAAGYDAVTLTARGESSKRDPDSLSSLSACGWPASARRRWRRCSRSTRPRRSRAHRPGTVVFGSQHGARMGAGAVRARIAAAGHDHGRRRLRARPSPRPPGDALGALVAGGQLAVPGRAGCRVAVPAAGLVALERKRSAGAGDAAVVLRVRPGAGGAGAAVRPLLAAAAAACGSHPPWARAGGRARGSRSAVARAVGGVCSRSGPAIRLLRC